jgi:thiol-disulfide isomerase/thioredoxin
MIKHIISFVFLFFMTAAAYADAQQLKPFVQGSWNEILSQHKNQFYIVHIWGLTCGPCREEMPALGDFLKNHPNLKAVFIDADLVPGSPDMAYHFLAQSNLQDKENWQFIDRFVEKIRYEIDPDWQGEIPLTYLINKNGDKIKLDGVADLNALQNWLDQQSKN